MPIISYDIVFNMGDKEKLVTCDLSSCLMAHRAFTEVFHCSLSAAIILISSHDLPSCLFLFLFNCLSPCCLGPSSSPLLFRGPEFWAFCNVPINIVILPQDVTNHIPSIIPLFLTKLCHARSFQQLLSTDMILPFNY